MSDYKTVKKRQHYVYRAYLDQWCEKNSEIHALDLKTLEIITKSHALETGIKHLFYKTKVDNIVYDMIIYKYYDLIKDNNPIIHEFIKSLKTLTKVTEYQNNKFEKHENLEIIHKNFLENYYNEKIESIIDPVLKKFQNFQGTNYNNLITLEDYPKLILFIVSQAFRTKSSLDKMTDIVKNLYLSDQNKQIELTDSQANSYHKICAILDTWKYTFEIINQNVNIIVYQNLTNFDFITSDQPSFINKIRQDDFQYYFELPLTPKFFIKIMPNNIANSKINFSFRMIQDTKTIEKINDTIHKKAYSYIYSNDRSSLENIMKST